MLTWLQNQFQSVTPPHSPRDDRLDAAEDLLLPVAGNAREVRVPNKHPVTAEDPQSEVGSRSLLLLQESEERMQLRSRRRRVFFAALVCILSLAALMAFILYPRGATFQIDSFDINTDNTTFYDGDQLMTNWVSNVRIMNHNFFPISIREMELSIFLEKDQSSAIGKGRGSLIYVSSRTDSLESIEFQMPVYAPSSPKPSLISECMLRDHVNLLVLAQIDLSWTHWSGKRLPLRFPVTVECKIPAMQEVITLAHLD